MGSMTRFIMLGRNLASMVSMEKKIRDHLQRDPSSKEENPWGMLTFSADFGSGIKMDVNLFGDMPHANAVLSVKGSEVAHSELVDDFFRIWELEYQNTIYRAVVVIPKLVGTFMDVVMGMDKDKVCPVYLSELCDGYVEAFDELDSSYEVSLQSVMGFTDAEMAEWMYNDPKVTDLVARRQKEQQKSQKEG